LALKSFQPGMLVPDLFAATYTLKGFNTSNILKACCYFLIWVEQFRRCETKKRCTVFLHFQFKYINL